MRRPFDNTDHAGAVARRGAFVWLGQLLDRRVRDDEALERVKADAEGDRELAFRERVGELALIAADEEVLLHELAQESFAFDVPDERPDRLPRAGRARVEEAELAFPLGIEKVVERADLLRLDHRRVVPESAGAGVGDERVKKAFGLHVVFPDVAGPPVFFFFHFRENPVGRYGLGHAVLRHRLIGAGAAHEDVEIFHAGFEFGGNAARVLRPARGEQLHVDTELRLEHELQFLSQLGARRNADDDLALFFRLLERALPVFFPVALRAQVDWKKDWERTL